MLNCRYRLATAVIASVDMPRIVSGRELASVIVSKSYDNGVKCDENKGEIDFQGGADLDLEDHGSVDSTGKGAEASTVDSLQGIGSSKRKPKRQRRY